MKKVTAFAPASVANLNVGFDCLGLSMDAVGDSVSVIPNERSENRITSITSEDRIPERLEDNCCSVVIHEMHLLLESKVYVDIEITKGISTINSLGLSSSSCVAAAMAYNHLLDKPFSKDLISFAGRGKKPHVGAFILTT